VINDIFLSGARFLINLPQVLVHSQLSLLLMENGATAMYAATLLSVYAISVLVGRFASGLALDRISPHIVAIFSLGLPVFGYLALAGDNNASWLLAISVALVGLAQGAETDIAAILTSRRFDIAHFSFVYSMLMTSQGLASAGGSALLSFTLRGGGTFDAFLIICAIVTLLGAFFFFLTGSGPKVRERIPGAIA
ncbi:MAG TPA: MFS transporter, partial [Novosphingobium sp.]|nr:MFS transporter [Novosphingobium sp.]